MLKNVGIKVKKLQKELIIKNMAEIEDGARMDEPKDYGDNEKLIMKYQFFQCECMSEGLLVGYFENIDDVDKEIYVSLFSHGMYIPKPRFLDRIKQAWRIITKGTVYDDQLILSLDKAKELGEYLLNIKFTK